MNRSPSDEGCGRTYGDGVANKTAGGWRLAQADMPVKMSQLELDQSKQNVLDLVVVHDLGCV